AALEPAATAAAPVAATLGSATSFVHGMIWATVEGLDLLAGRVIDATAALGAPPGPRPFRGHITLARQNQREQPPATRRRARGPSKRSRWSRASCTPAAPGTAPSPGCRSAADPAPGDA